MNELKHHGILGMKWGVRRYQNKDGTRIKNKNVSKTSDKDLYEKTKRLNTENNYINARNYNNKLKHPVRSELSKNGQKIANGIMVGVGAGIATAVITKPLIKTGTKAANYILDKGKNLFKLDLSNFF